MADAQLKAVISAEDNASKVIAGVSGRLESIGETVTSVGKKMTVGLTAPILAVAGASVKMAMTLDDARDSIVIATGAMDDKLAGLNKSFDNVFAKFPGDAQSVADVIGELNTRLGLTEKPLESMSMQMLHLAKMTGIDAKTAVSLLTRVFGDWSVATEKQGSTLNTLMGVSQLTGITVDNLAAKVVQFGAPLRQMGFSLEESALLMGKWEKEGVNSELVLGSLRIAMGNFARDNVPMREGLDATIKKIQELGPGAKSTSLAMETFGARAGPDMAAAILEGRFEMGNLQAQLEELDPDILATAEQTAGFSENLEIMKNRVMLAAEPLGITLMGALEKLMPYFERGIVLVTGWIQKFSDLDPKTQTIILGAIGLFAALGLLLIIIGTVTSAVAATTPIFSALGAVFLFIAANPIIVLIAALALMIAKVKLAMDEVGGAKIFFQQTWDGIKIIFNESIDSIVRGIQKLIDKIQAAKNALSSLGSYGSSGASLNPLSPSFKIPGFRASGGSVSPSRSFVVGENGPELFTPSSYGAISNRGGGVGSVIVNVYGDVSGYELIDKVKRGIMNELKLNTLV